MLEVKVLLHAGGRPTEIANVEIQQIAQSEGDKRDYKVKAWLLPMDSNTKAFEYGGVTNHDRVRESVLSLVAKAIAGLRRA